jgi:glycosyltransferase involved in cell wall biosynthesis
MASSIQLYGYLFCWDQTASGRRIGYPSDFYPPTAPFMAGVFTDTQYLKDELSRIYALPKMLRDRLMPLRSPARMAPASPTMGELGAASADDRARPVVLWGGRLDHQKRFDLVVEIARRMPHVDFRCWGTAMLDAPPDRAKLPANISMQGDFKAFTDLPLGQSDGWLFTSAWEGMPTTVIELATLGMPMVCSAVGGVPDLIDAGTGWSIDPQSDVSAYVDAVQDMVSHPRLRVTKALMAQARAMAMFSPKAYDRSLTAYLERPAGDLVA